MDEIKVVDIFYSRYSNGWSNIQILKSKNKVQSLKFID